MSAPGGPLRPDELVEIESCLLPALERHHLRLLAHGLRTFQQISGASGGSAGAAQETIPSPEALRRWADEQPQLRDDPSFRTAFLEQLGQLARQLEQIAEGRGSHPLQLELADLTEWARRQADDRLAGKGNGNGAGAIAAATAPPTPPAPPG
ncbi:MAG: hypothetical protein ACOVNL_06235 [Prochlorococcaceae cyanobacterium]|jgi:hypothetical protein